MQGKSKTAAYVSLTKNCSGCNTISGNTRSKVGLHPGWGEQITIYLSLHKYQTFSLVCDCHFERGFNLPELFLCRNIEALPQ